VLVIDACRAALAGFKVPREVIPVDELPRINFGKVNKVRLRELAAAAPASSPSKETSS
jgi:acyl-CoA synthetase (AMP-forming)/AMP-acid ligase II